MALIAVAADKGAPGVTTTAVALAALWPRRALLAEIDPAGGDLVYRSVTENGRPPDPTTGILSLAATARRGVVAEQLWDHAQRLSGGLDVLVGLANSDQAAGLTGQWGALGRAFAELAQSPHPEVAADVLADCGRLDAGSPVHAVLPHASVLLLVTRSSPEGIAHVRDRAAALHNKLHGGQRGAAQLAQPQIGVVLVADPQRGERVATQVNEMLIASGTGSRVVGLLAEDPVGAEQLAGRRRGRLERSLLVRSARRVVADLHQVYRSELTPSGSGATGPQQVPPPGAHAGPAPQGGAGPAVGYGPPPQGYAPPPGYGAPAPGYAGQPANYPPPGYGPAAQGPHQPGQAGPSDYGQPEQSAFRHSGRAGQPGSAPGQPVAGPGQSGQSDHWRSGRAGQPGPGADRPVSAAGQSGYRRSGQAASGGQSGPAAGQSAPVAGQSGLAGQAGQPGPGADHPVSAAGQSGLAGQTRPAAGQPDPATGQPDHGHGRSGQPGRPGPVPGQPVAAGGQPGGPAGADAHPRPGGHAQAAGQAAPGPAGPNPPGGGGAPAGGAPGGGAP